MGKRISLFSEDAEVDRLRRGSLRLTGTVGGQVDMSEATLGRVGFELGGYRSTDFWLWSLSHVKGLVARVEAIHGAVPGGRHQVRHRS